MCPKQIVVLLVLLFMASTSLALAPRDPTKPIPTTLQEEEQQTPQLDGYRPKPIPKKPPQLDGYRRPINKPGKPPQLDQYLPPHKQLPPHDEEQHNTDSYGHKPPTKPPQLDNYIPPHKRRPPPDEEQHNTDSFHKSIPKKPPQLDAYVPPKHKQRPPHDEEQHNTDSYIHKPPHHGPPNVGTTKEVPLKEQLNTISPKTKPGHGDSTQPNNYQPKPRPRKPPSTN